MPYFKDYVDMVDHYPSIHLIDSVASSIREFEENVVTVRAPDMAHWNNEGHRIAAEVITRELTIL